MADKKLKIALCGGIAVVAILMAVLLSTCSGKETPEPTEPMQTQPATEATQQVTLPPTEAPTEAPTEVPTEAPTEPEETEPAGSSTPGGSGGSGSDDDDEKPKETEPFDAPDAGSQNNPYVEVLGKDMQEISTVSLKEKESVYYEIYGAADTVLLLEAENVTLTMGETVAKSENGLIQLPIIAEAEPVKLQITNDGAAETSYRFRFARRGSAENPEKLESIASIAVELPEGAEDGYRYIWTVTDTCELSIKPGKTSYRIQAIYDGTTINNADSEDGSLTLNVTRGMDLQLQVIAIADEAGNYPAVSDVITGTIPAKGSLKNPIELQTLTPDAVEFVGGEDHTRYYSWTAEMSGTFAAAVTGAEPETVVCSIALNPEDTPETEETPETAALVTTASMEVTVGGQVLIRVETAPDETGAYPAAKVTFACTFTAQPGLEANPIAVNLRGDTLSIPAGHMIYYKAAAPGMEMTIEGENLTVIVGGTAYEATSGKIIISCGKGESIVFAVTNLGAEDASYEVSFVKVNTNPDPTEPKPTEPDSTEPVPTEPDSTEPDSTDPESTEPDVTEPAPTEPAPTEPEATEPEETIAEMAENPDATAG